MAHRVVVPSLFLGLVAFGCEPAPPSEVAISGFLVSGPSDPESTVAVAGGSATVMSRDGSLTYASTVAATDGFFRVEGLPPSEPVVLVTGKPDLGDPHAFAVFTGLTESVDLTLFRGAVYAPPLDAASALVDEYRVADGAPPVLGSFSLDLNTADSGGVVRGRVGRWIADEFGLSFVTVSGATVTVSAGGTDHAVCYHLEPADGEDTGVADCAATVTSRDARFAAFGIPPGPVTVTVDAPSLDPVSDDTLAVEDGVTFLDFFAVAFP